jgi:hypothetical protein
VETHQDKGKYKRHLVGAFDDDVAGEGQACAFVLRRQPAEDAIERPELAQK